MRGDGGDSFYQGWFGDGAEADDPEGMTFTVNYTLSIAKDQIGVARDTVHRIVDGVADAGVERRPGAIRSPALLNSNFVYNLPFGRDSTDSRTVW